MKKFNLMFAVFLVSAVLMLSLVSASWLTGYSVKEGKTIPGTNIAISKIDASANTAVISGKEIPTGGTFEAEGNTYMVKEIKRNFWGTKKVEIMPAPAKQQANDLPTDQTNCVDSDGGLDYYVWGNITSGNLASGVGITQDTCLGNNELREMFCSNNLGTPQLFDCSSVGMICQDGACIEEIPTPTTHTHLSDYVLRKMGFEINADNYATALNEPNTWVSIPISGNDQEVSGSSASILISGGQMRLNAIVSCDSDEVMLGGGYLIGGRNIPEATYKITMAGPKNSGTFGNGYKIEIFEPYIDITPQDNIDDEGIDGGFIYVTCAKIEPTLHEFGQDH